MQRIGQLTIDQSVDVDAEYTILPGIYPAYWCGYELTILKKGFDKGEYFNTFAPNLKQNSILTVRITEGIRGMSFIDLEVTPEGEFYEVKED